MAEKKNYQNSLELWKCQFPRGVNHSIRVTYKKILLDGVADLLDEASQRPRIGVSAEKSSDGPAALDALCPSSNF